MSKKNKILFVMHELGIGGAERVIVNLANNFDRNEYEIHLCLFKKKGALINSLSPDVIIHDLKAARVLTGVLSIMKLFYSLKPQVVLSSITHVNLLISILIPFLKHKLKHTLFITREVNNPGIRSKYLKTSKFMDVIYKRTISNFDCIIAQSNFMKMDIVKSYGIDENKIKVISNPVDIKNIKNKLSQNTSNKLFNSNKKNILAVGRLRKQKGYDFLLRVMLELDQEYHLTIIGEGAERVALENLIAQYELSERVNLLGQITNPYIYMEEADIFVSASLYEGFPNVIIEANACGTFVVAHRCPGVDEEIIIDNLNGKLVEFDNAKMMAETIRQVSRQNHDENIIKEIAQNFRAENIVKRYSELIDLKLKS